MHSPARIDNLISNANQSASIAAPFDVYLRTIGDATPIEAGGEIHLTSAAATVTTEALTPVSPVQNPWFQMTNNGTNDQVKAQWTSTDSNATRFKLTLSGNSGKVLEEELENVSEFDLTDSVDNGSADAGKSNHLYTFQLETLNDFRAGKAHFVRTVTGLKDTSSKVLDGNTELTIDGVAAGTLDAGRLAAPTPPAGKTIEKDGAKLKLPITTDPRAKSYSVEMRFKALDGADYGEYAKIGENITNAQISAAGNYIEIDNVFSQKGNYQFKVTAHTYNSAVNTENVSDAHNRLYNATTLEAPKNVNLTATNNNKNGIADFTPEVKVNWDIVAANKNEITGYEIVLKWTSDGTNWLDYQTIPVAGQGTKQYVLPIAEMFKNAATTPNLAYQVSMRTKADTALKDKYEDSATTAPIGLSKLSTPQINEPVYETDKVTLGWNAISNVDASNSYYTQLQHKANAESGTTADEVVARRITATSYDAASDIETYAQQHTDGSASGVYVLNLRARCV